jgi:hypothetical protein
MYFDFIKKIQKGAIAFKQSSKIFTLAHNDAHDAILNMSFAFGSLQIPPPRESHPREVIRWIVDMSAN